MNQNIFRSLFFTFSFCVSLESYAGERDSQQSTPFNQQEWFLFADNNQHALLNANGRWGIAVRGEDGQIAEVIDLGNRVNPSDATSKEKNDFIVGKLIKTGFFQINKLAKLYEQSLTSQTVTDETKLAATQEEDPSKTSLEIASEQTTSEQENQRDLPGHQQQFQVASGSPDDDYDPSYTMLVELPENDEDALKNKEKTAESITETPEIIGEVSENTTAITKNTDENLDELFNETNIHIYESNEIEKPKKAKTKEEKRKKKKEQEKEKKRLKELKQKEEQKKLPSRNVVDVLYYDSDTTIVDEEEYNKRLKKMRETNPFYFVITPEMVGNFHVDIEGIFNKDYEDTHEDFIGESKPISQVFNGVCFDDVSIVKDETFGRVIRTAVKPVSGPIFEGKLKKKKTIETTINPDELEALINLENLIFEPDPKDF